MFESSTVNAYIMGVEPLGDKLTQVGLDEHVWAIVPSFDIEFHPYRVHLDGAYLLIIELLPGNLNLTLEESA